MIEKTCFKCNEVKLRSEFYRHPQMGDGLLGKCKKCTKIDVANHRNENLERVRAYDRSRSDLPHRREVHRHQAARCRERYGKDWHRSHNVLHRAISSGAVIRPASCSKCGVTCKPDGHHDDHSKPLAVLWLCKVCHARRHIELKRLRSLSTAYGHTADWQT